MRSSSGFSVPNPYAAALRQIEEERAYGETMAQQAYQPLQGQMVGDHYIRPSMTQGLAQLAQAWMGGRARRRADEDETRLSEGREAAMIDALRRWQSGDSGALLGNPDTRTFAIQSTLAQSMRPEGRRYSGTPVWTTDDQGRYSPSLVDQYAGALVPMSPPSTGQQFVDPRAPQNVALGDRVEQVRPGQALGEGVQARMGIPPGQTPAAAGAREEARVEPRLGLERGKARIQLDAKRRAKAAGRLQTIQLARQQLEDLKTRWPGIKNTMSAGLGQGYAPTEIGQAFDAAVDPLRQTIRLLTRTPGEGAMSDWEGRISQAQLPDRARHESVTEQQIQQLEDLLTRGETGYHEMLDEGLDNGAGLSPDEDAELQQLREQMGRR